MGTEIIGKQIALLRREKGVKQEEVANYVGVSAQAVSKWENGGVPDVELLPKIADFFSVSIDSLFGRKIRDYGDIQSALMKEIAEAPEDDKVKTAFDVCWNIERALVSQNEYKSEDSITEYEKKIGENGQRYSSAMFDGGFTNMGIGNMRRYFLLVSDPESTDEAYFDGIDYPAFFRDMADKDFFDAMVLLHRMTKSKAFTSALLEKKLGIDSGKAGGILEKAKRYCIVTSDTLELDEEVHTVYHLYPSSSFVALLIFAREIIDRPDVYSYYLGNRTAPYLK